MTDGTKTTPKLRTVAEAMDQLGISRDKLYELMGIGEIAYISLPPHTHNAGRRIAQAVIDDFIARHTRNAAAAS